MEITRAKISVDRKFRGQYFSLQDLALIGKIARLNEVTLDKNKKPFDIPSELGNTELVALGYLRYVEDPIKGVKLFKDLEDWKIKFGFFALIFNHAVQSELERLKNNEQTGGTSLVKFGDVLDRFLAVNAHLHDVVEETPNGVNYIQLVFQEDRLEIEKMFRRARHDGSKDVFEAKGSFFGLVKGNIYKRQD